MRLTNQDPDAASFNAYLNDQRLAWCLMADEEKGEAVVAVQDADGRWLRDEQGETLFILLSGKVQLKPRLPAGKRAK